MVFCRLGGRGRIAAPGLGGCSTGNLLQLLLFFLMLGLRPGYSKERVVRTDPAGPDVRPFSYSYLTLLGTLQILSNTQTALLCQISICITSIISFSIISISIISTFPSSSSFRRAVLYKIPSITLLLDENSLLVWRSAVSVQHLAYLHMRFSSTDWTWF